MKNLTKVLAVVLALTMALSMVSFAAFTDVTADASYAEAVSILSSLDILKGYEDGSFKPDATITRAEFATVVCRFLGLGATAEGAKGQTVFTDVPADHWASGYIALASQQKIVNGMGNGIFAPEEPVTYEQAIKMVVAALGYTPMADTNGGYPGGYQIVAAQKGLLNNVKGGKQGEAATRAIVAQMSYNALEVPLMVQKGFGTQITFETGDQLLLNKLNIVKLEGAVDATSASDSKVKEDQVTLRYDNQVTAIDGQSSASRVKPNNENANPGVVYTTSGTGAATKFYNKVYVDTTKTVAADAKALLDYNVVMYVRDADTDDATLVAIAKRGTRNKELSFATEDIYDTKTTASKVTLDELAKTNPVNSAKVVVYTDKDSDKYETNDIAIDKVYINGRNVTNKAISVIESAATTASAVVNKTITAQTEITSDNAAAIFAYYAQSSVEADIRLLCNTTAGDEYNVAYITSYDDYVVDTITPRTYTIMSKDNGKVILDEENSDFRFEIIKDGKKISFADIAKNDVLSIAGYKNSTREIEYGTIIVTSAQVTGKVTTYDSVESTVTIDGKDYKCNSAMALKFTNSEIRLGDDVTMYANARGVLVGIDTNKSKTNLKYGFATLVAKSTGISDTYQIRLMNTEGSWQTLDFASKVVANTGVATSVFADAGVSKTLSTTTATWWNSAIGAIANGATNNTVADSVQNPQFIVNKVVAYEVNSSGEISKVYFIAASDTTDIFMSQSTGTTPEYNESTEGFGNVYLNDNTIIFSTDADAVLTSTIDEDVVSIAKKDALIDRKDYSSTLAYNVDEDMYAAVLSGEGLVGTISYASNFMVISGKSTTTNADGDEGINFTGVSGNETVTLFASTDTVVSKLDFTSIDAITKEPTKTVKTSSVIAKGDVVIYSKNAKGEADKIYIVAQASDIVQPNGTDGINSTNSFIAPATGKANRFGTSGIELYSFTSGTNDYKFIFGYAYELSSNRLILVNNANDTTVKTNFSVKSDANMAFYDEFYGSSTKAGRTSLADITDITFDSAGDKDADLVLMRVSGNTTVEDLVIYKAYSSR